MKGVKTAFGNERLTENIFARRTNVFFSLSCEALETFYFSCLLKEEKLKINSLAGLVTTDTHTTGDKGLTLFCFRGSQPKKVGKHWHKLQNFIIKVSQSFNTTNRQK